MTWNNKYWDIIEQLYWDPKCLGMRSIPQKHWQRHDGFVSVPYDFVNKSGPLYSRKRKISAQKTYLLSKEEILNHIFDITFSIAPDVMINEILLKPLGFDDLGPFESLGRESAKRYGWGELDNVTQHDGLFVSKNSAVGIEMKLLAKSSPEQVLKYAALLTWEEMHTGIRQKIGLLYIVPNNSIDNHWHGCGLEGPFVSREFLDRPWKKPFPKEISKLINTYREQVESVLDRIKLGVISWNEIRGLMVAFQSSFDPSRPGDQTLVRLIDGFLAQLEIHQDTGLH